MSKCTYYEVEVRNIQSRERLPHHQVHNLKTENIPYCSHKNSPVPRRVATSAIRGSNLLTCKGDREKCPLSETEFSDI